MLTVMDMKEAMETNRKEAGSDGKHGIEVKDNDYYSSSVAQISNSKLIIMIMLIIIFIFCNISSSLNLWRIFWWKLGFRYFGEVPDPLTYISNWATALILLLIAILSSCC